MRYLAPGNLSIVQIGELSQQERGINCLHYRIIVTGLLKVLGRQ